MDYSNYFSGVAQHVKSLYFTKGAAAVCSWIKTLGSRFLPSGLCQELREDICEDVSDNALSINIDDYDRIMIGVISNGNLLIWEVKVCS